MQFCLILFCLGTVFTLVKSDVILLSTGMYVLVKDCKIFISQQQLDIHYLSDSRDIYNDL